MDSTTTAGEARDSAPSPSVVIGVESAAVSPLGLVEHGTPDVDTASEPTPIPTSPDDLLRTLLRDHAPAMYRVALGIVRDGALAEDVVQESMLRAWQAAASFRGDASLRAWALRIAHNTAISTLRKRREELREPALLPENETSHPVDRQVQGKMMVGELWGALDGLDDLSRTIVVLRELEGLSYEEIGEALELPLPTVKTRLFRARRQLSTALKDWQ